ncbi:DUF1559 domain-containing protein [Anatilimnocola aggregata]|uniref:DUF1559 domain-containing protein n=1 Tax=Anatilimnocola aggregata TaxID=2528021 RepID=UPI00192E6255|nr:DUF1559 domain-containing protein [Anatilimnocola aggregata]
MLVVAIVLLVLAALLLPAMPRSAGEASRRMQCGNNIKQLCLGLQNYHDTFQSLPAGARQRTTPPEHLTSSWGPSWLVATLPFCEQKILFDKLMQTDAEASANDYVSVDLRRIAANAKIKYLLCPSSPLPETESLGGFLLVVPSYAGIMGGNESKVGPPAQHVIETMSRLVPGPYGGFAASNGMLPLNEYLSFADCIDGSSHTLIVGEVSDWYYDDARQQQNPALAFGGQSGDVAGWLAGTVVPTNLQTGREPVLADQVCNLITIEHAVGLNNKGGQRDTHPNWGTGGIGPRGLNNPLTSAHPAGATVGFLDGHVQLLTDQTDLYVLKRLAIRDDGGVIPEDY